MNICVITFLSVAHAMRAEKLLKCQHISIHLIPVPRSLSGSCEGLAAQVDASELATAIELLTAHDVIMLQKGVIVNSD